MPALPFATSSKAEWRRWAATLAPVDDEITQQVVAHVDEFLAGVDGPVLAYVALPDEIRLDRLDAPPPLTLPRLGDDGAMTLHLDDGVLERHRFGIDQPPAGARVVEPEELSAVLVPGRVFDRDGYRLGRGGGHYDRLLPRLAPGTPIVGVTVEARIVARLPREPHDRPMTHLATERGVFSTN